MENPPAPTDAALVDAGNGQCEVPSSSESRLFSAHDALEESDKVALDPNSSLEDIDRALGSNGLEISMILGKSHGEEGHKSVLANQSDGVEAKVRLDSTQDCNVAEDVKNGQKKRHREDEEEVGRCLKSKSMENEQDLIGSGMDNKQYADQGEVMQGGESTRLYSHEHVSFSRNSPQDARSVGAEVPAMDVTTLKGKEVCSSKVDTGNAEVADENKAVNHIGGEDATSEAGTRVRPRKKRKIAMLLAYCGAGYQGMQKNPGAVTIEGELEEALGKAGAMPDNYDGNPRKVDWMRAARTDKGVSAVGQVVSGLFYVDPPGFVERVNSHLPRSIRLLGYKRVTPTFSAKKLCDRRRYEYVIPTFALDPSAHRDREVVLASEGTDGAFIKCLECSERGRKVLARKKVDQSVHGNKDIAMVDDGDDQSAISNLLAAEVNNDKATASTSSSNKAPSKEENSFHSLELFQPSPEQKQVVEQDSRGDLEEKQEMVEEGPGDDTVSQKNATSFQFTEVERAKLNCIFKHYIGTHNFHNFTSRVKAEDPSAKRFIVSFEAGDVFTIEKTEFVRCTVIGQSFMLHQIRKMIGLAIAVFRGCAPESILDTALRRDTNITVPTAPELGLFLDECLYPVYNQRWYNTHEEVSQKGYEEEIRHFKFDVIYEHIAATEHKEGQMALFLHSLNDRNYADFGTAREAEKTCLND